MKYLRDYVCYRWWGVPSVWDVWLDREMEKSSYKSVRMALIEKRIRIVTLYQREVI